MFVFMRKRAVVVSLFVWFVSFNLNLNLNLNQVSVSIEAIKQLGRQANKLASKEVFI